MINRSNSTFGNLLIVPPRALSVFLLATLATVNFACKPVLGQAKDPNNPNNSAPVDIEADSQEFNGDMVIAHGNVRVKYKDTLITAPEATLFRDAGGSPQRAIFKGHSRLLQDKAKLEADVLTFEISDGAVVMQGHAHSEVDNSSDDNSSPDGGGGGGLMSNGAQPKLVAEADQDENKWDPEGNRKKMEESKKASKNLTDKIITDSDFQERSEGKFEARGNVHVRHAEISVTSQKLHMVYGADSKPETCVFNGNASATQYLNHYTADQMIYFLSTKRLQATGNVKSKVVEQKSDDKKKGENDKKKGSSTLASTKNSNTANSSAKKPEEDEDDKEKIVYIVADSQDYSEESGRISAYGSVKLYYDDIYARGPKLLMTRSSDGQLDKAFFFGRSQITQPGKRWIADRLSMAFSNKRVLAEGNTNAIILKRDTTVHDLGDELPGKAAKIEVPVRRKHEVPGPKAKPSSQLANKKSSSQLAQKDGDTE